MEMVSLISLKMQSSRKRMGKVVDIESLIPEIKEKITDTNEMKDESIKKVAEMKEQIGFESSSSSSSVGASTSTAKLISTLSFKRKKDDDKNDDANDTKKAKGSDNGDSSTS